MNKKYLFLSFILFIFMVPGGMAVATETMINPDMINVEPEGIITLGPGSNIPFYDPIANNEQRVWLSNVEPSTATWSFYDPNLIRVYEETHTVSIKEQGPFNVNGNTYQWVFADRTTFTVPAFAKQGTWIAMVTYTYTDGSSMSSSTNYGAEVSGSDVIGSLFVAPWYFFNMKMPPLFWFPGILLWLPAILVIVSAIFTRTFGGFVTIIKGAVDAGREARGSWKRNR